MNDFLMRFLLGQQDQQTLNRPPNIPGGMFPGTNLPMPGPIGGFGGGTFDLSGRQVTPVRPETEPPATLPEKIGHLGGAPEALQDMPDEQDVTVDGWKPKKRTTLGTIADILIALGGNKSAPFAQMKRQENLQGAMEGFTQDPLNAIRRMAQIPGMQDKAWDLYMKHQDDQRADLGAQSLRESRSKGYLTRMGGLLRALQNSPDPNAAYGKALPILKRLAERAGFEDQIPDTYDPAFADMFVGTNIDPDDQIKIEALERYRNSRLELDTRKANDMKDYRAERLEDFDNAEAGRNVRADQAEAGRNARSKNAPTSTPVIRNAQGDIVGLVDKSGKFAKLKAPDGGKQYFEMLPNGKLGKRIPNELVKEKGK